MSNHHGDDVTPDEIRSWLAQIEQRSQHVETADHRRLLDELDEIAELLVGKHDLASEGLKVQVQQLIDRIDPSRAST
jgi:hypothetical protein